MKKILKAVSLVGPGLFLIGYNIGTGSVTTMAKAGAEYGMTLFWALALSCLFTYILMVAYGQVTLVTGKTALYNIKTELPYGKILAIYIFFALVIGELLALMGIMGIVTDLLQEGLRLLGHEGAISSLSISCILIIAMFALLYYGRYKLFERILIVFVLIMGLCFITVFFLVDPNWNELLKGLIPGIPNHPGAFGIIAAMVGTTCSAAVFIIRSIVVSEKGWNMNHLQVEKQDAFVSAMMMLFLSAVIMAVSAGTLHLMGLRLEDSIEMIQLFSPIGGKLAAIILITGITGAALSTIFPIILIAPWLICDYRGIPRNIRSPLFRILGLGALFCALIMHFINLRPPFVMIFSQAFQACILPAVTIPILLLINNKRLMKIHRATLWQNIGIVTVLLFSILTTILAIISIV